MKLLFFLGIMVVGIFILPINSNPPVYFVGGIVLIAIGAGLVLAKSKK